MNRNEELKKELFERVYDNKYKKMSIIEICYIDYRYICELYKLNKIEKQTLEFLEKNRKNIQDIHDSITIEYFRRIKYEELVDNYFTTLKEVVENNEKYVNNEHIELENKKSIKEEKTKKVEVVNVKDTDKKAKKEKNKIEKSSKQQKNKDKKKLKVINHRIDVLIDETRRGKIEWMIEEASSEFRVYKVISGSSIIGPDIRIVKLDIVGKGVEYILYRTMKYRTVYRELHYLEEVILETKPTKKIIKLRSPEEQKAILEEKAKNQLEQKKKKQELVNEQKRSQQIQKEEKEKRRREEKERKERQRIEKQEKRRIKEEIERKQKEEERIRKLAKLPQIDTKSFMIRRSVFKCMHNNHKLHSVTAVVNIIDINSDIKPVTVSAGYCEECKVYFVLESSYEKLKKQGIPICRVNDEKTYLKNITINGMQLAQESILMQYGYTVSQGEGLSASRRQKILAVMVDNQIISQSGIVSYLDFFISQRQYQSKYEVAISKWEADREFIYNYQVGKYSRIGISAIFR